MRVALIHTQYRKRGGAETYFLDLVKGFSEQGDWVDVYVFKQDRCLAVPHNVTIRVWCRPLLPKILRKWCFAHWVKKQLAKKHYDLTLSNTRTIGQQIMVCGGCHAGYLARLEKTATWQDKIELKLERLAYQSAKYIVAHSQQIADELAHYYPDYSSKIKTLYPPCDITRFHRGLRSKRQRLRAQWGIAKDQFLLVFPSSGNREMKGYDLLLKAMALLPVDRYQLLLAGSEDHPKQPNIRALGFVADMPGLLSAADLMVLPSYYEAFGLVVIEALACGTPVVVSKYVGAAELIGKDDGIMYPQQTAQCLAQSIEMAAAKAFNIVDDFCQQHQLTVGQHLKALEVMS